MRILSWLGRKAKPVVAWAAVKMGDAYLDEVLAENEDLRGQLDVALGLVDLLEKSNTGLTTAVGLLEQRNELTNRNGMVTIASLLTVAGGEASVTEDTIRAVEAGPITIDYDRKDGVVTLKLVVEDEAPDARDHECCDAEVCPDDNLCPPCPDECPNQG